jgi:hypothetical protein
VLDSINIFLTQSDVDSANILFEAGHAACLGTGITFDGGGGGMPAQADRAYSVSPPRPPVKEGLLSEHFVGRTVASENPIFGVRHALAYM